MTPLELPDGRLLDVEVTGPADGVPLVFHHGTPGSGIPSRGLQRAVHAAGLRLVTYSRAGAGGSTRNPGRTVADVVPDLTAVLDWLGAERCVVAGRSGGGPHALAMAALLPERVAAVCSICGVGPWGEPSLDFLAGQGASNLEEWALALEGEAALRPWLEEEAKEMSLEKADPAGLIKTLESLLPPVDVACITGEYAEDLIASTAEAVRLGVDGWLDDDLAFTRPWGFDLGAISVPTFIWQGSADLMVPFAHGVWLRDHIPGSVAHLVEGEGHLSISLGAADEMIGELAAAL